MVWCKPGERFKEGSAGLGWSGKSRKVPEVPGWPGAGQAEG